MSAILKYLTNSKLNTAVSLWPWATEGGCSCNNAARLNPRICVCRPASTLRAGQLKDY